MRSRHPPAMPTRAAAYAEDARAVLIEPASCAKVISTLPPVHFVFPRGTVMSDDRNNRGPADRSRINVNEPYEVDYWCRRFGCSESRLRDAVKSVGVMVSDVERYLRQGQ